MNDKDLVPPLTHRWTPAQEENVAILLAQANGVVTKLQSQVHELAAANMILQKQMRRLQGQVKRLKKK